MIFFALFFLDILANQVCLETNCGYNLGEINAIDRRNQFQETRLEWQDLYGCIYWNKDHQRIMVDPMFMIIQNISSFLNAVTPTAVTPTAVILLKFTWIYFNLPKIYLNLPEYTWIYLKYLSSPGFTRIYLKGLYTSR